MRILCTIENSFVWLLVELLNIVDMMTNNTISLENMSKAPFAPLRLNALKGPVYFSSLAISDK